MKILWILWSFLIMAVPCERSTEACAELAAESFEEGFEESCLEVCPFSLLLLNCLLERQKGSDQSGKEKVSSLQCDVAWLNLPVRAIGRDEENHPS